MKKRIVSIVPMLMFLCLLFSSRHNSLPVFSVSNATEDEIENELVIALFFKNIDSAVQSYYSNYFSIPLEVYSYEIEMKDLSKENNIITIRFGVTP